MWIRLLRQLADLTGFHTAWTRSGHSLDYGIQKVCVPKTRDLRPSQQGERLVKIFDGLHEVCTGKDRHQS